MFKWGHQATRVPHPLLFLSSGKMHLSDVVKMVVDEHHQKTHKLLEDQQKHLKRHLLFLVSVVLLVILTLAAAGVGGYYLHDVLNSVSVAPQAVNVGGSLALVSNGTTLRAAGASLLVNASLPGMDASPSSRRLASALSVSFEHDHLFPYVS